MSACRLCRTPLLSSIISATRQAPSRPRPRHARPLVIEAIRSFGTSRPVASTSHAPTRTEGTLEMTPSAIAQIAKIQARENDPTVGLRVAVDSGGCHGYSYKLELGDTRSLDEDDRVIEVPTGKPDTPPALLIIDKMSLSLLRGAKVDFATELIGSTFRVIDNPQAKAGCGCGISWELKDDVELAV